MVWSGILAGLTAMAFDFKRKKPKAASAPRRKRVKAYGSSENHTAQASHGALPHRGEEY
jgi:hypothetical protein